VGLLIGLICAGILFYSQTAVLDWDEGFHLVAASLIAAGRRPYVDFLFPQPWLHAAWNALWLWLSGGGWRGPHFVAGLETSLAIALTTGYAVRSSKVAGYAAAVLVGLNPIVVEFGTKAQAYGACLLLTVSAFRATVSGQALLGGLLAGVAVSCSLLSAPVAPVLVIWHCCRGRWRDGMRAALGVLAGTVPVALSFVRVPSLAWFNLVEYHARYRRAGWTDTTESDLEVLRSCLTSIPALLLIGFAVLGLRKAQKRRPELMLAAALAAALALESAFAHPTFPQYFVLTVPFLAMLAGEGFVALGPRWPVVVLCAVSVVTLGFSLIEMRDNNNSWTAMAAIAQKIRAVTPAKGVVLADPPVYFALKQQPPSGMEFPASHDITTFDSARTAELHIVPQPVLIRRVAAGEFATVETCRGDEDEIIALDLPKHYSQKTQIAGCDVYWNFR
jgi:hypothetical protein